MWLRFTFKSYREGMRGGIGVSSEYIHFMR